MNIQGLRGFGRLIGGGMIIVSVPFILLILLSGAMAANTGTIGTTLIIAIPLTLLGVGLYFFVRNPEV